MKIVKNDKSGTYSVRYNAQDGSIRSTNLKVKTLKRAQEMVKELGIEKLETAAQLGVLSQEIYSKLTHGSLTKYDEVFELYTNHLKKLSRSGNTITTYIAVFKQFGEDYKATGKPITRIKEEDLFEFLNRKDQTTLANRKLRQTAMNGLFKYAMAKGFTSSNPMALVSIDKSLLSHRQKEASQREPFTYREYFDVLNSAPYFYRQATALSYWTGLRLGDICCLEWDSLTNNTITVWTEKKDKRVVIPIDHELCGGDKLRRVLSEIEVVDETFCFPEQRAIHEDTSKRSRMSVYFGRICQRAGVYDKTFHCLRHSFITRLSRAGVMLEDIGKIVGHSSKETTKGYAH
jgi:integrase